MTDRRGKRAEGLKVIAEFSIHPIGEGTSVGRYVGAALAEISKSNKVRFQVTPMATILEADSLSDVMDVVKKAHESLFKMGAMRVSFILRVDDRRDKAVRMEEKVRAVTG